MLMPNTDPLLSEVFKYATTPRWEDARDMLARKPEQLLTDKAAQYLHAMVLSNRIIAPTNPAAGALVEEREAFLQRARTVGVAAAWAERQAPQAAPSDLINLPHMVADWLKTPTFPEQRAYLATHLALLDPLADNIMGALLRQFNGSENDLRFLQASAIWLQRARQSGLDAGWEAFCQVMNIPPDTGEAERLMQMLLDWLNTKTYGDQRAFLESHPDLLNPTVDRLMEVLLDQFQGKREAVFLRASQIWLQRARTSGLEAGWQAFQLALQFEQPPQNL
jgi:hypothetical protein